MATAREALEERVKFWRSCIERPYPNRCKKCPDGTYKLDQYNDSMSKVCDKCGHVLPYEEQSVSIGPLYDMGAVGQLKSCVEQLEKLLQDHPQ